MVRCARRMTTRCRATMLEVDPGGGRCAMGQAMKGGTKDDTPCPPMMIRGIGSGAACEWGSRQSQYYTTIKNCRRRQLVADFVTAYFRRALKRCLFQVHGDIPKNIMNVPGGSEVHQHSLFGRISCCQVGGWQGRATIFLIELITIIVARALGFFWRRDVWPCHLPRSKKSAPSFFRATDS